MDDFTYNLIASQQDDPMLFQNLPIPTVHPCLDHTIPHQDLQNQVVASSLASCQENTEEVIIRNSIKTAPERQRKASSAVRADNHDHRKNPDESNQKKANHRDIERQRRQEMVKLYASLRNLVPLVCKNKRKRSVSDDLLDAVNHIKHTEKNIRELEAKRDKLINLTAGCCNLDVKIAEETNSSAIAFTVRPCLGGGIEILMKNFLADIKWFRLSKILDVLLDEGLTVVSCVCTKVNEEFLYTIQTEANADVDLICLQEKLTDKVMTWKDLKSQSNTGIETVHMNNRNKKFSRDTEIRSSQEIQVSESYC